MKREEIRKRESKREKEREQISSRRVKTQNIIRQGGEAIDRLEKPDAVVPLSLHAPFWQYQSANKEKERERRDWNQAKSSSEIASKEGEMMCVCVCV